MVDINKAKEDAQRLYQAGMCIPHRKLMDT